MNWTFVYKNFTTGGLETFVLRVGRYITYKGGNSTIVCFSISEKIKEQLTRAGVIIKKIDDWNIQNITGAIFSKCDITLTFGLSTYYSLKNMNIEGRIILYCVHPYHLTMEDRKNNLLNMIKKPIFSSIIKKGIQRKEILFMDHPAANQVAKQYNFYIPEENIILLPFEKANKYKKWADSRDVTKILSICRADFPFKAYVIGLIKAVKSMLDNHVPLELTVISYGENIEEVRAIIGKNAKIHLVGETEYKDLEKYYLEADIYVGMGTTSIEAAKYGIPNICAKAYSYEFLSCGLFCDNPEANGMYSEKCTSGIEELTQLISMNNQELKTVGEKCRIIFEKNYGMEQFCQKFMSIQPRQELSNYKIYTILKHFIYL